MKININDQSSKGKDKHYKCSESAFSRKRENKQAHGFLSHEREKGIVPIQKGISNLFPPQKPTGNCVAILVQHLNEATVCKLGY